MSKFSCQHAAAHYTSANYRSSLMIANIFSAQRDCKYTHTRVYVGCIRSVANNCHYAHLYTHSHTHNYAMSLRNNERHAPMTLCMMHCHTHVYVYVCVSIVNL